MEMKRCGGCRHLQTEPAASRNGTAYVFLKCGADTAFRGRVLSHVPKEFGRTEKLSLPRPAWCRSWEGEER
ncbi:MAG: hypothetical protein IKQ73_07445 [Oscillospiraceae bacterium]|nr:hypothetical protein [Oscillospiraceae bacterium]